ncbi:MAG: DUF1552 domain-containing protein [Planctomycetota bacterium]
MTNRTNLARTSRMLGRPLERRTLLRGLGATLALPLLDAMQPSLLRPGAAPSVPSRLVYVYVPNGVNQDAWWPSREGRNYKPSRTLAALGDLKDKTLVLRGLTHDKARANGDGPGDHARAASTWLTGVQILKGGATVRAAQSADQIVAAEVGGETRFRSLEIGCERGQSNGECDSGYACAYNFHVSWKGDAQPLPQENDPRMLFERIFGDAQSAASASVAAERRERRKSVLDYVGDEIRKLRRDLGAGDRHKIDQFADALREFERKLEFSEGDALVLPDGTQKPTGIPGVFSDHVRLLFEVLALALRADQTRVATFMYAREVSSRTFPEIGVPDAHHALSHHGGNAGTLLKLEKIDALHMQLFGEFLARLDSYEEGSDSVLDHSMIVYGSCISDGDKHNHENLPTLVAGGGELAKDRIKLDRYADVGNETPMNELHIALMKRMGIKLDAFGDADRELSI